MPLAPHPEPFHSMDRHSGGSPIAASQLRPDRAAPCNVPLSGTDRKSGAGAAAIPRIAPIGGSPPYGLLKQLFASQTWNLSCGSDRIAQSTSPDGGFIDRPRGRSRRPWLPFPSAALALRRTGGGLAVHKLVCHAEQVSQHIGIDARQPNQHAGVAGVMIRHVVNRRVRID